MYNEVLVVEGKNDKARILAIFPNLEVIITNGSEISDKTLEMIEELSKNNKIILFLDPDFPGERIRNKILERVPKCENVFIKKTLAEIPFASVNGDIENRLPGNANILFKGISGERILFNLDLNGVCASLGAACSAGSLDPSKTLIEMGLNSEDAKSSIRFTFSKYNTAEEVEIVVNLLKNLTKKLK